MPLVLDITEPQAAKRAVAVARSHGTLRWLVNNAGMARFGEFRRTQLDEQLQTVQLNCSGLLAVTAEALPVLSPRVRLCVVRWRVGAAAWSGFPWKFFLPRASNRFGHAAARPSPR